MRRRTHRRRGPDIWPLVVVLPWISAGATWLWAGVAIPIAQCRSGSGGGIIQQLGVLADAVLVLGPAVAIAIFARHTRPVLSSVLAPMAVATLLTSVLFLAAAITWWTGHGCYD